MLRLAMVVGFLAGGVAFGQTESVQGTVVVETEPYAELVHLLNHKKVKFDASLKGANLRQVLEILQTQFDGRVKFVVRQDQILMTGPDGEGILERPFVSDTNYTGVTLHDFLKLALAEMRLMFLVRKNFIEITTIGAVREEVGAAAGNVGLMEFTTPLVCGVYNKKPLEEVLAEFGRVYDRTITVSANAADKARTEVTVRLMNVPLSTAVDMLANEVGLVAVEKNGAILVTTKENAAETGWKPVRTAALK